MNFVNEYRGANRDGNNKKRERSNVKKKAVSPKRLDRKSTQYSFNMNTSSKNDELELRAKTSKEQIR